MTYKDSASFQDLLIEQVGNEFAASQQYLAVAVYFDGADLPQLAARFYRQALEERNHAMMIVRYLLDKDVPVVIPGVPAVVTEFHSVRQPVELALDQERGVTEQITLVPAEMVSPDASFTPLARPFDWTTDATSAPVRISPPRSRSWPTRPGSACCRSSPAPPTARPAPATCSNRSGSPSP